MIPLAGIILFGFLLRVLPQLDNVFTANGVMLHEVDPYLNFRLLENMVANFPHAMAIDAYANYQGMPVGFPPLQNWVATLVTKLGVEPIMVAAWMPPVLGALLAIPVYLIGKELFGKQVGWIAAFIAMILPSEALHRSLLGFYDHHILEATFFFWALFLFVKFSRTEQWKWAIAGGVALGLYLITWLGGMLGVTIIALGCAAELLLKPSTRLASGYAGAFVITAAFGLIYWSEPFAPGNYIPVMPLVMVSPLAVLDVMRGWGWAVNKGLKKWLLAGILMLGLAGATVLTLHLYGQEIKFALASVFWGFGSIISEAQPSYPYVWVGFYGVGALLMFGGMYYAFKKDILSPLFVVTLIIFFVASIGQRRWSYYFSFDVALLSGLLIWQLSKAAIKSMAWPVTIISLFFVMLPLSQTIYAVASLPTYNNQYYQEALVWLRENTVEPFSDDYYLDLRAVKSDSALVTQGIEKPFYTVLAWWDYGHWINQVSHRVALANPAEQMSFEMRAFWMSQNEDQAEKYLEGTNVGIIFATQEMTDPNKFYAVLLQLGEDIDDLEQFRPNSMAVRMWTGEGITKYQLVFSNEEVKIWVRDIN